MSINRLDTQQIFPYICVNKIHLAQNYLIMKKIFTLILTVLTVHSYGQIISQYVETNAGTTPKGIEIWNNTNATLDFATNNLIIEQGTNGAAPTALVTVSTGTLAPGEVIVIGTTDIGTYLTTNGLTSTFVDYTFTFNGDDALVVKYGTTTTDVFGIPGTDPGSYWGNNGVNTQNQNIQLLTGITTGSTAGFSDPSTRFETVNSSPAPPNPAGLAGFGIAPVTNVAAFIDNIFFSTEVEFTSVHLEWNCENWTLDQKISIDRRDAFGRTTTIRNNVEATNGKFTDANLENGQYVYTLYSEDQGVRKIHETALVEITANNKIQVAPNPARDIIYVFPLKDMDQIDVYSMEGRQVLHISNPEPRQSINLSSLPTGIYFVKTRTQTITVEKQ